MPPQRMASATSPTGTSATCSQLGNRAVSRANARSELRSEVCCDSTVATTSSMIGSRGLGMNAPWCSRSRRCTALMRRGSGVVIDHLVQDVVLPLAGDVEVRGCHADTAEPVAFQHPL